MCVCVSVHVCLQKGGETEEEEKIVVGEKGQSNLSFSIFLKEEINYSAI